MMGGLRYWEVFYDVSNTIVGLISTDLLYLVWLCRATFLNSGW